jgi:hypothetical protein
MNPQELAALSSAAHALRTHRIPLLTTLAVAGIRATLTKQ